MSSPKAWRRVAGAAPSLPQEPAPAISPSNAQRSTCQRLGEFGIDDKRLGDDDLPNENKKGRTDMAKAGLYALGCVLLFGVLLIGAGFVLWDTVHGQPKPLPAPVS
jgi:hypothetical protein